MKIMFADEADHEPGRGTKFFVYGGVIVDQEAVAPLSQRIEAIRRGLGFAPTDALKFATNSRPANVSRADHTEAKRQLMVAGEELGAKFIAYATLHDLARNVEHDELVKRGANTVLGAYNHFLTEAADHGLVLMDRMPVAHEHRYFQEKFQLGLRFPNGATRRLDRIVALASTCDGASHIASLADVVLGSFRYCVNEPERDQAGRAMFPQVARLMWGHERNGRVELRGRGLQLRPLIVRAGLHAQEYDSLVARLIGYLHPP